VAEILVMPKLGLTMEQATLNGWRVEVGAPVREGEPICEVETEKLTVEVESPATGVLLQRIEPGPNVPVGAPMAIIGSPGEDTSAIRLFDPASRDRSDPAASREASETPAVGPGAGRARAASPIARRLAVELGVDIGLVTGTGPRGRITRDDIEAAAETASNRLSPSPMRRAIAAAMTVSATVPQFALERDVDIGPAEGPGSRSEGSGAHATVADAIAVALARALTRHRRFLCSWSEDGYEQHDGAHLGIAVALDEGLVVPVVRNADLMSAEAFAQARRRLQRRARAGALTSAEASGAVFTLTNLGALGVDRFRALVNPPESGILAVGRVSDRGGRRMVTLTLSADHRVVDGADGARLLADVASQLEIPADPVPGWDPEGSS